MSLETLKTKVGLLIEKAQSGGSTDELEAIIDNSGVLDSTEGTVEEKVERLVDKAEDENLWYLASENMNIVNANSPFRSQWTGKTIPKINFSKMTSLVYTFGQSPIEYIDYYINSSVATNFSSCFYYTTSLKSIVGIDTSNATTVTEMFRNSAIETIQEPLNFTKVTSNNNVFGYCAGLKSVGFVAETIKVSISFAQVLLLNAESIQSIIDGLASVETAQTLTLHADVKAKLTQTQLDTITGKNWNLA